MSVTGCDGFWGFFLNFFTRDPLKGVLRKVA